MKSETVGRDSIRKTHFVKCEEVSRYVFRIVAIAASVFLLQLLTGTGIVSPSMAQGNSEQVLHNEDVIQMVQAKLSDGLIVAKIKSSACKFDTSTGQLIKLKSEGVSDEVLKAMAECGAPTAAPAAAAAPPADPNNPDSPHPPGIYLVKQGPAGRQMITLEPTSYSGEKMGGFFKSGMTVGLAKVHYKVAVPGGQAALRIQELRPTFYFYFDVKAGSFGNSGGIGGGPSNPDDFSLARLEEKKDHREVVVGQMGITGGSTGLRSKDTVPFDAQNVRPGEYKVVPKEDLKPGEYCFFFGRSGQTMGLTGGTLFAFGIDKAK